MSSLNILKKGINDTSVGAYYDYIVKLAILCGASQLSAEVEMKEVLNFEIELAKVSLGVSQELNFLTVPTITEICFEHWGLLGCGRT